MDENPIAMSVVTKRTSRHLDRESIHVSHFGATPSFPIGRGRYIRVPSRAEPLVVSKMHNG